MEKHYPPDLPPIETGKIYCTIDVLFKVNGDYKIGFYVHGDGNWHESCRNCTDFWHNDDIECWWYLPE